jgi:hypothetical protein
MSVQQGFTYHTKKMLVLLFIVSKLSYGNDIRFWKNYGVLAEKTKEKIPVDTVETIKTLYEYPVTSADKINIMEQMVGTLVDDGFGRLLHSDESAQQLRKHVQQKRLPNQIQTKLSVEGATKVSKTWCSQFQR